APRQRRPRSLRDALPILPADHRGLAGRGLLGLTTTAPTAATAVGAVCGQAAACSTPSCVSSRTLFSRPPAYPVREPSAPITRWRSEEHTSELQSRQNLVC